MEFFIITLAIFGGFFRGTLKKVSDLDLSKNYSSEMKASLLPNTKSSDNIEKQRNKETKEIEEIESDKDEITPKEKVTSYKLQVINKGLPVKISDVPDPEIKARAAIILDMETDKIMFAKNSNEELPIASISKIFTALAVYDKIDKDKIIKITQEAVDTEALAGDLKTGEEFKMADLADLMLISSSNDAAAQLAMEAGGSRENFAVLMNKKADQLGLKKTRFFEPTGLSDQNISTAFEIAQAADATFAKSPIWDMLKETQADIYSLDGAKHHLKNTNEIIGDHYIIAGKTGYTNKAKGTLVVIADSGQDGRKIISVVLGSEDRFGDTRKLIKWAREGFKW